MEDAVEAFDNAWLLPPQQGEIFETAKACLRRLQGYALSRGFAVVTTSSKKTRARFSCIHHGVDTRNWREGATGPRGREEVLVGFSALVGGSECLLEETAQCLLVSAIEARH